MSKSENQSLTYHDAGVDIDAGNQLVENIKPFAQQTHRPEVMGNLGGFGALCRLPQGYQQPVLVSATDGVGTKVKLAIETDYHDQIGIDLVAMCVNDLIVLGAQPLYFLDYYATSSLEVEVATSVIRGIAQGCLQANCSLVGGETAEMPGLYQPHDYDLAGFCTGIVEEKRIIDGSNVREGDLIIGLPSSGPHSNGYSLIRKIIDTHGIDLNQPFGQTTLAKTLLEPTKIYVQPILDVIAHHSIHAICHITGGGFWENIPRILPKHLAANLNYQSWSTPAIFEWIQQQGGISNHEMLKTFNCGIGLLLITSESTAPKVMEHLTTLGEQPVLIGSIEPYIDRAVTIRGID